MILVLSLFKPTNHTTVEYIILLHAFLWRSWILCPIQTVPVVVGHGFVGEVLVEHLSDALA